MVDSAASTEVPITVLIAEDEEDVRNLLARTLWADGYRTLEARDGSAALHMARLARPHLHLVITDIVMPNMDGRQLGRYLGIECPEVPIIYISAFPPGDLFSRDGPAGSMFLQKPFSTEELQGAVRSCLSARRSERSGQQSA